MPIIEENEENEKKNNSFEYKKNVQKLSSFFPKKLVYSFKTTKKNKEKTNVQNEKTINPKEKTYIPNEKTKSNKKEKIIEEKESLYKNRDSAEERLNEISKKMNIIDEKLFFIGTSVNKLSELYSLANYELFLTDNNFNLLYANPLFLENNKGFIFK
jgi:hypothetical protein